MFDRAVSGIYDLLKALNYHHPIHPLTVHVPIGLILGAFILSIAGSVRNQPELRRCAWYCQTLALIFALPAIAAGLMDWHHSYAGAMLFHFKVKFILAALFFALLAFGFFIGRSNRGESKGLIVVYALGLCLTAGLGYIGGELVYGSRTPSTQISFKAGEEVYLSNCDGCHLKGGNQMNPALPVKNSPKLAGYQVFADWIRAPKAPMPPFPGSAISDRELKELYDYITNVLNKT